MLTLDSLKVPLPHDHDLLVAFDTGTYMSAVFVLITPEPYAAVVLWESPNYRYVGGEIELLGMSNPEWARNVHRVYNKLRPGTTKVHGWVDENTQFKAELANYGLSLHGNNRPLELRVEIAREYVNAESPRIFLAPWLSVLPYEMENAQWPDESTSAGRFVRIKRSDHTLDCLEHILSRRPRTRALARTKRESFLQRFLRENRRVDRPKSDPHLGRM